MDVTKIALELDYHLAFAPLLILKEESEQEGEGSAILSRFPIIKIKKYKYSDHPSADILVRTPEQVASHQGKRASDRFLYNYTLLAITIKNQHGKPITIATTYFPVVDHNSPGLADHELKSLEDVQELEHIDFTLEHFLSKLRLLKAPIIFTADLNNARGEYVYDTIANELVDIVPQSVLSTIDPKLHRHRGLKLVVDTIMISPNISVKSFTMIQGVSDHQALIASLKI